MSGSGSVLVIGGDDAVRRFLAAPPDRGDVEVAATPTVDAGLARLNERAYDVVLLASDEEPPADALAAVRAASPAARVIVVSGGAPREEVVAALRGHAFAYFKKPIQPEEVRQAVVKALAQPGWEDGIEVVSARREWICLRLRCRKSTADRVLSFLAQLRIDLGEEERESIGQAVREILLNAIEHGAGLDENKHVRISRVRTQRLIIYHVADPGEGFSMEGLTHAAVANPPDDPMAHVQKRAELGLRPGGFGILVTRSLVDDLIYSETGNEVLLIKHLDAAAKS